ncbi:MAG: hypothetical protein KC613_03700, partial [Myxococcales bacterium]|nr:hypothetical protein [Myxococcales bacterium]
MAEDVFNLGQALDALQDEQGHVLNELGQQLLTALFATLRTASMHSLKNQAMDRPFEQLTAITEALSERLGEAVVLRLSDGNFFVNKRLVKLDFATFENTKYLVKIFEFLNINELTFQETLERQTLEAFVSAALNIIKAGHGYIEDKPLGTIRVRKMKVGEIDELRRDKDPRNRILATYAQGLLMLRQFVIDLHHGRTPRHARVKRLCLDLIDIPADHHNILLALVHLEAYKGTLFSHMMNTAVLSIVFGHRLGLTRRQLVDLGLAAFHHDLGWALLADDRLEDTDGFGLKMSTINAIRASARQDLERVRTQVAQSLVHLGGFNEMVINRLIVAFECQVPEDQPAENLYYTDIGPSFMSNVVRVASAYDELTSPQGTVGPAMLPDQAMRHILDDAGKTYDRFLATLFAHCLGAYPVGTLVELDTTEIGLVVN